MGVLSRGLLPSVVLLIAAMPAAGQNDYSFLRAEDASVDYSSPVRAATGECAAFVSATDADFAVIAAREIFAANGVPRHCRIDAVIAPEVGVQINLPLEWNGRLYMHGNGGYAGTPPDAPAKAAARDAALLHHFATAYTNTGHDSRSEPLASFGLDDRQKEIDYAFRAVHLTVNLAKRLAADYYGAGPDYSYWDGCSTGGRQGLISAQRFPDDFDGIIAGAPVLDLLGTQAWNLWNVRALEGSGVTSAHIEAIGDAVYAQCDAIDGLADGLIRDPRACGINPAELLPSCSAGAGDACLTGAQRAALAKIYDGVESRGEVIFPGLPPGAERGGWMPWLLDGDQPGVHQLFGESAMRYLAFPEDDPDFVAADFDFDNDYARMDEAATLMNATDPDLSRFRDRGGKMIGYFGWADAALNPLMGVHYYEAVMDEMGAAATRDFYRLYMVPGMFHCRGGLGVDRLDAITPLIDWVESGVAPAGLPADRVEDGVSLLSRKLCPYPEVSIYNGSGSTDEARNFTCTVPPD